MAPLCLAPALVSHPQRCLYDRQLPRIAVIAAERIEDAGLLVAAAVIGEHLLRRLPPDRRGAGGDRGCRGRAGAGGTRQVRQPAAIGLRPRCRRYPIAGRRPTPVRRAGESVLTGWLQPWNSSDVQLQKMPRLLLLLSPDRPRQARR